jgi:xanthine dehydrogenase molybdopterin-binding subunit B
LIDVIIIDLLMTLLTWQAIAIVVADTADEAAAAARAVVVDYEVEANRPAITTIDEAIAANSFHGDEVKIEKGNVALAFAAAKHVVEGDVRLGGQVGERAMFASVLLSR